MKIVAMRLILTVGLLVTVTACIPKYTGGKVIITTAAATEAEANRLVIIKAQNICALQNTKVQVIEQKTIYQGINKNQKNLIKHAKELLPASKTVGSYFPVDQQYSSTLTFKCE